MSDQKTEQKPEHEKRIREALEATVFLTAVVGKADLRALLADLDAMRGALELYLAHAPEPECAIWRHVQQKARAALSEAKAGGWVAVPVEPTPQMTWAATVTADREWCYHVGRDDAKKLWAAMLAARPLPAPPAQRGEG